MLYAVAINTEKYIDGKLTEAILLEIIEARSLEEALGKGILLVENALIGTYRVKLVSEKGE